MAHSQHSTLKKDILKGKVINRWIRRACKAHRLQQKNKDVKIFTNVICTFTGKCLKILIIAFAFKAFLKYDGPYPLFWCMMPYHVQYKNL